MGKSQKNLTAVFTDTANAIRAKKSTSAKISPLDFADEIASIPTGITPTGYTLIGTYLSPEVSGENSSMTAEQKKLWKVNSEWDISTIAKIKKEMFCTPAQYRINLHTKFWDEYQGRFVGDVYIATRSSDVSGNIMSVNLPTNLISDDYTQSVSLMSIDLNIANLYQWGAVDFERLKTQYALHKKCEEASVEDVSTWDDQYRYGGKNDDPSVNWPLSELFSNFLNQSDFDYSMDIYEINSLRIACLKQDWLDMMKNEYDSADIEKYKKIFGTDFYTDDQCTSLSKTDFMIDCLDGIVFPDEMVGEGAC